MSACVRDRQERGGDERYLGRSKKKIQKRQRGREQRRHTPCSCPRLSNGGKTRENRSFGSFNRLRNRHAHACHVIYPSMQATMHVSHIDPVRSLPCIVPLALLLCSFLLSSFCPSYPPLGRMGRPPVPEGRWLNEREEKGDPFI